MQNQDHDPLGHVVQDALAIVLDQRLRNLEARLDQKTASAESAMNEIRVNHLRGDLLLTKTNDFPAFSGSPAENFVEWAKKLEKQMILKGIKDNDDQLKTIFLEFHLRGDAQTKFDNLSNSENPPTSYDQFKAALQRAFPNQRDTLYHRQILKDRKQKRTESVTAYYNELEKLGRLAYPTLDKLARDTILESIFLEGLQTDVRKALKFKRFLDLNHLIEEATFVEKEILRDEANVVSSPSARYHVGLQEPILALQPPVNNVAKQIDQINERLDKLCLQLRDRQSQDPKGKITCNSCGKIGHISRECRSKIQCEICGRSGHSSKECKSKCFHCKKPGHKSNLCKYKDVECFHCKQKGHLNRNCPQKLQRNGQNNIQGLSQGPPLDSNDPDFYPAGHANQGCSFFIGSISSSMIDELATIEMELDFTEASPNHGFQMDGTRPVSQSTMGSDSRPPTPGSFLSESSAKSEEQQKESHADISQHQSKSATLDTFRIPRIKKPSREPLLGLGSLEPNLNAYRSPARANTVFDRLGCTYDTRTCRCTRCKKYRTESRKNRRNYAKHRLAIAKQNGKQ